MPSRPPTYRPPGRDAAARRAADAARGSSSERGYSSRWQRFRLVYLAEHPLCEVCKTAGRVEAATDVHHIDGRGPLGERGYDPANLESLCHSCHSKKTAARE